MTDHDKAMRLFGQFDANLRCLEREFPIRWCLGTEVTIIGLQNRWAGQESIGATEDIGPEGNLITLRMCSLQPV